MNEIDEPRNHAELIELIRRERAALENTLSRLDEEQLLQPLGPDGWKMSTVYVPALNPIFRTEPLTFAELMLTLVLSSIVFFAVELEKFIKRSRVEEVGYE